MKNFTLNLTRNKKKIRSVVKNTKTVFLGNTNFAVNVIITNKYIINKHIKFNINISKSGYNNILYTYKNINE